MRRPIDHAQRTREALESMATEILDYFDRSPPPIFLPSEGTLRHRRGLMLWSVLVITVLAFNLWPDKVPVLGVTLKESFRDYFAIGAFLVIVYHVAMDKLLEYRDLLHRHAQRALVDFAFGPRLEREASQFQRSGHEIPEGWTEQSTKTMEVLQSESHVANGLLKEMLRWPPALLLGAAWFFISRVYAPLAYAYTIAVVSVFLVIWIERRLRKRALARITTAAEPPPD